MAPVEGSRRRRSCKCGWAGLFLVLSWGGRGHRREDRDQGPEVARRSTCPVARTKLVNNGLY